MKIDSTSFSSAKPVSVIGRQLQDVLGRVKASSIEPITSGSGALAAFDDAADIEVVAQGQGLVGGSWAVQIYVRDNGAERAVELVAIGDGGLSRAWNGARNTASLTASIKRRDAIADALR